MLWAHIKNKLALPARHSISSESPSLLLKVLSIQSLILNVRRQELNDPHTFLIGCAVVHSWDAARTIRASTKFDFLIALLIALLCDSMETTRRVRQEAHIVLIR